MRIDGRVNDELRPCRITLGTMKYAEGSCRIEMGDTHVLCAASVQDRVPPWLVGSDQGWVTAEYSMLPRAAKERSVRESVRGRQGGRTMEIQRLIGRAVRSVVDLNALGERTVTLDCDVTQADGGTRTASVTGAFVAFVDAVHHLSEEKLMGARCKRCGTLSVPPRPICVKCHASDQDWVPMQGRGKLAAYTCILIGTPAMIAEGYGRKNPYCSGVVELEEGGRVDARIRYPDAHRCTDINRDE